MIRLWWVLVRASVRSQMQYKASFAMVALGNFVAVGMDFLALWALYARFGGLNGWTLPQLALLYGMVNLAFALAEMAGRGFDQFGPLVKTGDFDRFLLRPWPTALLLAGQIFEISRVGRIAAGLGGLLWGAGSAGIVWTLPKALLVAWATLGGAGVFYGVLVLQATMCFWTVESLEIVNAITYGGITAAEMPLTIYPRWLRLLFTFVVPLAVMNYLPADVLLNRSPAPALAYLAPLTGVVFLVVALRVWKFGERKYTSAGG